MRKIAMSLRCIVSWLQQDTAVKGYQVFLLLVACQKRKLEIDGLLTDPV